MNHLVTFNRYLRVMTSKGSFTLEIVDGCVYLCISKENFDY